MSARTPRRTERLNVHLGQAESRHIKFGLRVRTCATDAVCAAQRVQIAMTSDIVSVDVYKHTNNASHNGQSSLLTARWLAAGSLKLWGAEQSCSRYHRRVVSMFKGKSS